LRCSSRIASRTRHANKFPRLSNPTPSLHTDAIPVAVQLTPAIAIVCPTPFPLLISDPSIAPVPPPPTDFFDMVKTPPHWQSSLLAHLDSKQHHDRLKQLLESGDTLALCLVSDGGAKGALGSFGWEIAVDREILWTCMGPTFGLDPGSFRAELHGMLSALLFLELYLRFFDVLLSDSISPLVCCDNLGLIQRVNYAMNRSWDNPNHCLSSEYDVKSGIVDILNRLPFKLTCLHVKGHQDDDAPVAELPWEAQMNCHADACATDYLNNWSAPSKVVPFISASQASISLAGVTLTRNVARRLRQAASSPALAQRIMTANGWNTWILNSIAWDSQSKALGTLEHTQEIFVTKWAHNLLPIRRHMKRIGQAESDLCPSYLSIIETAPHIFACPKRVPWQVVFLDSHRKLLAKLHTQPDLQTILMTGIKGALQDDPLFDMPTCNREASFQLLVSSQNDISWSHLLRGRFSRQWILLQQAHLDQDADCSSLLTGERWLQKVLHHLWTHLCSAWKLRNANLHRIDKADQELKRKAKLRPAIVALCTLDKRIFDLPLDTRLDKTTSSDQAAWINLHAPTVRIAKASAADKLLTTQRDIRSFFVRVPAEQGDQQVAVFSRTWPAARRAGQCRCIFYFRWRTPAGPTSLCRQK
jgi:hypothetical protein